MSEPRLWIKYRNAAHTNPLMLVPRAATSLYFADFRNSFREFLRLKFSNLTYFTQNFSWKKNCTQNIFTFNFGHYLLLFYTLLFFERGGGGLCLAPPPPPCPFWSSQLFVKSNKLTATGWLSTKLQKIVLDLDNSILAPIFSLLNAVICIYITSS